MKRRRAIVVSIVAFLVLAGLVSAFTVPTKSMRQAVRNGDVDQLNRHLLWGRDVNKRWPDGRTLLHIAAALGRHEVVEVLIAEGAEVNRSAGDVTPLDLATLGVNVEPGRRQRVVELLLAHGADLRGPKGRRAASNALDHPGILRRLLARGIDLSEPNGPGFSLLHQAAASGYTESVKILIAGGMAVDGMGRTGVTPLFLAASAGNAETCALLLAQGAEVNKPCADGRTALHTAVYRGHIPLVKLLLARGADADAADHDGHTPLDLIRPPRKPPSAHAEQTAARIAALLAGHTAGRANPGPSSRPANTTP